MKKINLFTQLFLIVFSACTIENPSESQTLTSYVNPFVGTGGHGHTYPGATMPFGMMQLSPDTRLDGWDGCSGYHYTDNHIYGFSHTHLSSSRNDLSHFDPDYIFSKFYRIANPIQARNRCNDQHIPTTRK